MIVNNFYNESNYDILQQYLTDADSYAKEDWEDLFVLIKLGHYDVHDDNLSMALKYYNELYHENVSSVDEVHDSCDDAQLARLHNRISPMEEKAYQKCLINQ